jgi:bifunctional non-homologous end joining protein LigD
VAADKLKTYRGKRRADATPEPPGKRAKKGKDGNRFVIQEHSATALHWDLRLERDGVLASWALPRGLPLDPKRNHMAVHTEDHPLEYLDFHGDIPKGNYGAGWMGIWDTGTYETEEWEPKKLVITLHGKRVNNKFALFQAGRESKNWLIHRMDPPPDDWEPLPEGWEPMRASVGKQVPRKEGEWAYEIEWAGLRVLAYSEPGRLWLQHPKHGDVTAQFPEVRRLNRQLSSNAAIFDGVVVAFDGDGLPVSGAVEKRLTKKSPRPLKSDPRFSLQLFDILHFDGRPMLELPYSERRELLEELELAGDGWQTPGNHRGEGRALLDRAPALGLPGIVAKRLDSTYRPGVEAKAWRRIKAAPARTVSSQSS